MFLIKKFSKEKVFGIIFLLSLALRVIYIFRPTVIWWDASIYIAMGKWLFSSGAYGYFEPFRPVIWPFIQGFFWKVGFDPLLTGKIVQVLASLGAIWLIYKIGEKIKPWAGVIAAGMLSFTPFFFGFTNVGLTDIPSVFFILFSIFLLMEEKVVLAGLMAGFAFLWRFPHALFIISLFLFFIIEFVVSKDRKAVFKKVLYFSVGFSLLTLPFFIANQILYLDFLYPIKVGQTYVSVDPVLKFDYIYYVRNLLTQNPLLVFAPLSLLLFLKQPRKDAFEKNKFILLFALSGIIYMIYFSILEHKEVRYAIGFLPFFSLLSGIAISSFTVGKKIVMGVSIAGLFILFGVNIWEILSLRPLETARQEFYEYFAGKDGERLITSTPMVSSISNVKLLGVFDSWAQAEKSFAINEGNIDYVMLDTCGLNPRGESLEKQRLLAKLQEEKLEFSQTVGSCELFIYKLK